MTISDAQAKRQAWQEQGNRPCHHVTLALQQSENGYLTGQYVCTRCGAEVRLIVDCYRSVLGL